MRYRLRPKQGLFLDPPEADAGKLEAWEAGRLNGQGRSSWLQIAGSGSGEAGFTLIEVIAALIIVSVLAAMIFPVTGGGMWRTARGVGECRELFELQGQMEEIVRLYKTGLADGDGAIDLEDFKNSVESYSFVDSGSTGFLTESGSNLTLTTDPTSLLLVTLTAGDQRIANIFSQ